MEPSLPDGAIAERIPLAASQPPSIIGEATDILVANTVGVSVMGILGRAETLTVDALLHDLMQRAIADETLSARLAFAAWKKVRAL
jgi:hypothetical protein